MKLLAVTLLASIAHAREHAVSASKHADYASGAVMDDIMRLKTASWDKYKALGHFTPGAWKSHNRNIPCVDGYVTTEAGPNHHYKCLNLDVTGHLSHDDLCSEDPSERIGASIWGWTIQGREFVAIAQTDGAAFAEVVGKGWWNYVPFHGKPAGTLDYIGRLPKQSVNSIWREIKGYHDYAIIGSEAIGHGVQIFDMKRLLAVRPWWNRLAKTFKAFDLKTEMDGWFNDLPIGRSHNVVIAEASNHVIAVGAQPRNDSCASGLIFIDMNDPKNPKKTGCAAGDGYVHDARCLIYHGPDKRYEGKEICYGFNEDSFTIYDITDKTTTNIISRTAYDGVQYCHQGWELDPNNQEFLLMDDELDEMRKSGPAADQRSTTYIWNIANLEKPMQTGLFKSTQVAIDHNQYIHKGFSYQSNYGAGLRILDVSGIPSDPTGGNVKEVAFFDVFPNDDEAPKAEFMGTWGSYGLFNSGHIVVNTYDRGAFVVKRSRKVSDVRAEF